LQEQDWQERARNHRERVDHVLRPHRERKSRHETHPVYDFLFSYYSFRISGLERWTPGFGVLLKGEGAAEFLDLQGFVSGQDGVWMNPALFPEKRKESVRHIRDFLRATANRPPNFGCAGLHEWAMVYKADAVRHGKVPLRMPPEELAAFVDSQTIVCSHFDAFRFFTEQARPLNRLQPTREKQMVLDQPGCLHVNMDLYKWAYKFSPWISSELIWDCFLLSARAREIDMRASPYDLRALGFEPIRIETADGRKEYETAQRGIAEDSVPVRNRLIDSYEELAGALESAGCEQEKVLV